MPNQQWRHARATNPVESPFAGVRLRTDAATRFKKVENSTAVLWKMLMIVERSFKGVKAPELMKRASEGVIYLDGREKEPDKEELAA